MHKKITIIAFYYDYVMKYFVHFVFLLLFVNTLYSQESQYKIISPEIWQGENAYKWLDKTFSGNVAKNEFIPISVLPWNQTEILNKKLFKQIHSQIKSNYKAIVSEKAIKIVTSLISDKYSGAVVNFKLGGHTLVDNFNSILPIGRRFDFSESKVMKDTVSEDYITNYTNNIFLNRNYEGIHGGLWVETRVVKKYSHVSISKSDLGEIFECGNNQFQLLFYDNGIAVFKFYKKEPNVFFALTNENEDSILMNNRYSFFTEAIYSYYMQNKFSSDKENFVSFYADKMKGLHGNVRTRNEILIVQWGNNDCKFHFFKPVEYWRKTAKIKLRR